VREDVIDSYKRSDSMKRPSLPQPHKFPTPDQIQENFLKQVIENRVKNE
jgi:hypothetical protein